MGKQVAYDADARGALSRGVDKVARAVRTTLGPRGRAVILDSRLGGPTITLDGGTVAGEIELAHPIENLGARMLKEVAAKTQEDAGDGTTTATVLAQAIVLDGIRHITAGANPMAFKRGVDRAVAAASEAIARQSRQVGTSREIAQVAAVSAGYDFEIGRLIADAFDRIGREGVATVDEARGIATTLDVVEGMQFAGGYLSPYFVTDAERLEGVLEDAWILCCTHTVSALEELLPILEQIVETGRPFLLLAEDVTGEALSTLVVNVLRANLRGVAVKAPGYGERRLALFEDVAVLTGAQVIDRESGRRLNEATLADLGAARRVVVGKESTTLIGGGGDPRRIERHRGWLDTRLAAAATDAEREELDTRRARCGNGVAVIHVGAATEIALRERKARYEDALSSTRSALREGIVPGGGLSLVRAAAALDDLEVAAGDEQLGVWTVRRALDEPLRRLALNAGVDGGMVIEEVRHRGGAVGFNAATLRYEDLFEAGIIDPTLVVRSALQNAGSIGGLLLTTDAVVTDGPQTEPPAGGD